MRSIKLFLAIAVLFLSVTACLSSATDTAATQVPSVPSDTPQAAAPQAIASGLITQVVMAKGSDSVSAAPVGPTTVFGSSSVIHATVKISNAPANTKFTAAFYVVDVGSAAAANSLITSTDLTADGTRYLDFTLTPTSSWPSGKYRVDISVNGQLDQTVAYTVR
jgi:hypothetical protein